MKNIEDLKEYNFEIEKIVDNIKKRNPKSILLQFPDGLKPYATTIANYLEEIFPKIDFSIWLGTCFGACDTPQTNDNLIIQFGHAPWNY